jgi:hypothetical protein
MHDTTRPVVDPRRRLSVSELRKLPIKERNAILDVEAALAEPIYRQDRGLTEFEAFGEDDLHGESSSAEAG